MTVGDDYEIVKKIGQGGMGETFLARQISLDRRVVLKRLTNSSNDEDYEDIKREGRLLASLAHPNAISVFGLVTDGGENYLVEEYFAEGRTLRDVIVGVQSGSETLSRERFSHIAIQLISVLEEAHSAGLIHRDVKPENILIDKNDRLKLCDFGIAKNLQTSGPSTTGVKGTWEYLAPELLGENPTVTLAVDAYGAGYVFFELLCGRSPFSTEQNRGLASLLQDKVSKEPRFEGIAPGWVTSEAPLLNDLLSLTPEKRGTALNRLKVALESEENQGGASKEATPDGSDTRDVLDSGEQRFVHDGVQERPEHSPSASLGDRSKPAPAFRRTGRVAVVLLVLSGLGFLGVLYPWYGEDAQERLDRQETAYAEETTQPPGLSGFVNDYADVIDDSMERQMIALSQAVQDATGAGIAAVVVDSVAPYADVEEYSLRLASEWDPGDREKDSGVLFVLALEERQVRIEVGYGLEGTIPDGRAGEILDSVVLPLLRAGNYGDGLLAGMREVANLIAEDYGVELSDMSVQ